MAENGAVLFFGVQRILIAEGELTNSKAPAERVGSQPVQLIRRIKTVMPSRD